MKLSSPFAMTLAGWLWLLLVTGCGDSSSNSSSGTNTSGSVATAPADYLSAVTRGEQTAVKVVDVAQLKQAVQMFNVDHGRNPKDLNELVTEKYIPVMPPVPHGSKLDYDATSGNVRMVKE